MFSHDPLGVAEKLGTEEAASSPLDPRFLSGRAVSPLEPPYFGVGLETALPEGGAATELEPNDGHQCGNAAPGRDGVERECDDRVVIGTAVINGEMAQVVCPLP